ncbi:hypothetical protein [Mucilaginibacter sp.]|uniref:hypothetical protein n=1 Tax=Mucilaginibacter sp. TaxID=1882438 RepID=UPI0025CCE15A|nr:hypothetical protein [Mucilaginibacter sp.]
MYLTNDNKKSFKAIIILNEMINGTHQFQTVANGDDSVLEPLFIDLMSKGYMTTSGMNYQVTASGRQVFDTFMKRYTEYLKVYDIFSYVDLEKGEFAFERYFDFETDDAWFSYTDNERFDDLRIAVAIFKKVDPAEIVFMSFINENRFDTTSAGWQMDLVSDNNWSEIEEICNAAIKPEEVGDDAMVDMVNQGSELMIKLMQQEQEQNQNQGGNNGGGSFGNDYIEQETVTYYEPYYDPYYISPIWLVPLFLW